MIGAGSPIVTGGSVISGVSGTIGGTVGVMGCGFSGVIGTPPALIPWLSNPWYYCPPPFQMRHVKLTQNKLDSD